MLGFRSENGPERDTKLQKYVTVLELATILLLAAKGGKDAVDLVLRNFENGPKPPREWLPTSNQKTPNMIIDLNNNISLWQEFNPVSFSVDRAVDSKNLMAQMGINKQRIRIKERWFDVISQNELVRKRNKDDGYYRVVYIQINWATGEYYIGKANRSKWSEIKRYQGSGLKFSSKLKKHKGDFERFFIAMCDTAQETENLESQLVDKELLADERCLNLVAGGGGTTEHPSSAATNEKKRRHMQNHPEQLQPMKEAAKRAFQSGDTPALRARSTRIKEVMSAEKYKDMTRTRLLKWKEANPEQYADARKASHERIRTPEVQAKRKASFENWVKTHPEEHKAWQEKLVESRTSKEARGKRKESLRKWRELHPKYAQENSSKRACAAAKKLSKPVSMTDLQTGHVLQTFPSQHAAALWLVENGKAKNKNCVSSISQVCLCKPSTTGYGYRKMAYGYGWKFEKPQA